VSTDSERLLAEDAAVLWHPFTQQQGWASEDRLVIDRAEGCELIDAAVREQLDRVAHTTMLGLTHRPAIDLATRLVELAPPRLSRVFYSDSGSTAAEIALKMAFQFWQQQGGAARRRTRFVSLREATTATRSARSRSAGSSSSTRSTARCCSRRSRPSRATRPTWSACSPSTPARSPR